MGLIRFIESILEAREYNHRMKEKQRAYGDCLYTKLAAIVNDTFKVIPVISYYEKYAIFIIPKDKNSNEIESLEQNCKIQANVDMMNGEGSIYVFNRIKGMSETYHSSKLAEVPEHIRQMLAGHTIN